MRTDFNVTIASTSKAELTPRERIMLKDTSDAQGLDELVADDTSIIISTIGYAVIEVHNDKAKGDKDYEQYLILDSNGNKYTTGSSAFWNSFKDIWDEMNIEETGESFDLKVYRKPSKNYSGKSFITCSIM